MNDEVFRNAKGWLIFKGNVDPGWNNRNVQIYKRLCKGCEWTLVKKTRTDGSGRWRTRIYAPRTGYWFWKGLVPKTGGYGKSVTQIYRTYVDVAGPTPRFSPEVASEGPPLGWGPFAAGRQLVASPCDAAAGLDALVRRGLTARPRVAPRRRSRCPNR